MNTRLIIVLIWILIFYETTCHYDIVDSVTLEGILRIQSFTSSPNFEHLAFISMPDSQINSNNRLLTVYSINNKQTFTVQTPHSYLYDDHCYLLWFEMDQGPLIIQVSSYVRKISTWNFNLTLNAVQQLPIFYTEALASITTNSSYFIMFGNKSILEQYQLKSGNLQKIRTLPINLPFSMTSLIYSSKRTIVCWSYDSQIDESTESKSIQCFNFAIKAIVYRLNVEKCNSLIMASLNSSSEEAIIISIVYLDQRKDMLKLKISSTDVKSVNLQAEEISGDVEAIYPCEGSSQLVFKLQGYMILIIEEVKNSLKVMQKIEINYDTQLLQRGLRCSASSIAYYYAYKKFDLYEEAPFNWIILVISLLIILLFILASLASFRQLYFLLSKNIVNYIRSNKFITMVGVFFTSLLNYGLLIFCEFKDQKVIFLWIFVIQFFILSLFFSVLECSEDLEGRNTIKILKLRGFSIFHHFFSKIYYLFTILTIQNIILLTLLIALQSIIQTNWIFLSNAQQILTILSGLILSSLSIVGCYLALSLLFRSYWPCVLVMFLVHILTMVFSLLSASNPFILMIYNGLGGFTYLILRNTQVFRGVPKISIGAILVSELLQVIFYFSIYLLLLIINTRNSLKYDKSQRQSIITQSSINEPLKQSHGDEQILKINHIQLKINKKIIFEDVTFQVKKGSIFVIYGSNKTGKSCLIQTIMGFRKVSHGEIMFKEKISISCSLSSPVIFQNLTFQQHIKFYLLMDNCQKKDLAVQIQGFVDDFYFENEKQKRANKLSGGNLKKLCLATAFVKKDTLIVLDEPSIGVDVRFRKLFWEYLKEKRNEGSTIIMTTSSIEEAEAVADTIFSLEKKCVVSEFMLEKDCIISATIIDCLRREQLDKSLSQLNKDCWKKTILKSKEIDEKLPQVLRYQIFVGKNQISKYLREYLDMFRILDWSFDLRHSDGYQAQDRIDQSIFNLNQQKAEVWLILLRQAKGVLIKRVLIYRSNISMNVFTLSVYCIISFFSTNELVEFSIRLGCFLVFQMYKVRLEEKNLKKIDKSQIVGMNLIIYWTISYLFDLLVIFVQITGFCIIVHLNNPHMFSLSLGSDIFLSFWYMSTYVAVVYVILAFINNPTTFLAILFFFNGFIPTLLLFLSPQPIILQGMLKQYFFPFTLDYAANSEETNHIYLVYQTIFWLSLFACIEYIRYRLRLFRPILNVKEITFRQNQQIIQQQYRIGDRERQSTPIVADYIFKRYQKAPFSLRNISIMVQPGEVYGLMGANGAGKTTLFNILTLQEKSTSGIIQFYGTSFKRLSFKDLLILGYCPQFDYLQEDLTTIQNIEYAANIKGLGPASITHFIARFSEIFQFSAFLHKKVKTISQGQRRILCFCLTFIGNPKILFFDEPSAGMDTSSRAKIWPIIQRYAKQANAAVILTTHNVREAESYCDRVGLLHKGELVAVGSLSEVIAKFSSKYRLILYFKENRHSARIREIMEETITHFEVKDQPEYHRLIYDMPIHKTEFHKLMDFVHSELKIKLKLIDSFEMYKHRLEQVVSYVAGMSFKEFDDSQ